MALLPLCPSQSLHQGNAAWPPPKRGRRLPGSGWRVQRPLTIIQTSPSVTTITSALNKSRASGEGEASESRGLAQALGTL